MLSPVSVPENQGPGFGNRQRGSFAMGSEDEKRLSCSPGKGDVYLLQDG
jgi:hypothetical protein